jgi:hypothetical protein
MLQGVLDYCLREECLVRTLSSLPQCGDFLCAAPSDVLGLLLGPGLLHQLLSRTAKGGPIFPFRFVLFRSLPAANFRVRITGGVHRTFRRTSVSIDDSLGEAAT